MLERVFPYQIHLQIFQLFEYRPILFWRWIFQHFWRRSLENKKPLVWTSKVLLIVFLTIIWQLFFFQFLYHQIGARALMISILLATQSYLWIIIAYLTIWPLEYLWRQRIKMRCRLKMIELADHGLKVIGITGSYGKTSTKHFLNQILRSKYRVLATPESFNTILGIAKVVELELDQSYQFFICEYGAFKKGSISELVSMVRPDYSILTGINQQHLEEIGTVEDIVNEKFALIDGTEPHGLAVVCVDSPLVKENLNRILITKVTYGRSDLNYSWKNLVQSDSDSTFDLILDGKPYRVETKLFGQSNIENLTAAATMAYKLGIKPNQIIEVIKKIRPIPHRFQVQTFEDGTTVIDNAFSSNVDGFSKALDSLTQFQNRPKILVTPGIILLGKDSQKIHQQLGQKAGKICQKIILVGRTDRTLWLAKGINQAEKVTFIDSTKQIWPTISSFNLEKPVVLIENDLPDNY